MSVVSVIIPAYNAERYISDAITSALAQSFKDIEVLVIDDGSSDQTVQLVSSRFPQVKLVSKPNGGASSARNLGCQLAQGEFIAFLDADDEWHPGKIEAQIALMRAYPQAHLCRTAVCEERLQTQTPLPRDPQSGLPDHEVFAKFGDSFFNPFFATSTVMVRRSAFERVGGFDTSLKVSEDVDFYLKVLVDAPFVPKVNGIAIHKRPVKGSLGDDSEAGYVQLLAVYERFLVEHPQARTILGASMVNKTMAAMWARLAASQLRNSKRWLALKTALKSLGIAPNSLAARVTLLALFRPQ